MKYTGFKIGYRCSKEYGYKRRRKIENIEELSKELILKNIAKQGFISRKFMNLYYIINKMS